MISSRRLGLVVKRAIDVGGAIVGLTLLSPILAWAAFAVVVTMGRPILFRQERPGRYGRSFTIIKFRTMRTPRPGEIWYDTDAQRVTRLGRLLRSTSVDELPELWNVLRGEMSLVGPRPLLVDYLDHYTDEERRRHEMRPGLTGWAAVNGRNTSRFEDRLQLDVWYVDHWSLGLDVRILIRTLTQVLRRTDVRAAQDLDAIDFPRRFETGLERGIAPPINQGPSSRSTSGSGAVPAQEYEALVDVPDGGTAD